jgi:hypothetical protein
MIKEDCMRKVIWSCWFQGRDRAPPLVRKCLHSWESLNPGWEVRVLDAQTVCRYVDLHAHVDLTRQTLIAASLSNIVRILLLHEYGGVWADATTLCNVPLDDWLPLASNTGFFAFARPGEDRLLSSWFLAAQPGNSLVAKWAARTLRFWQGRQRASEYHWFHYQFGLLCSIDNEAFRAWQRVPRISAAAPSLVYELAYEDFEIARSRIDWTTPLFKLSYRLDPGRLTPGCLLGRLLGLSGSEAVFPSAATPQPRAQARPVSLLKARTENLGDHIQAMAGENLLRRAGLSPAQYVDCDAVTSYPPPVPSEPFPVILLNGEFKGNTSEWPPDPAYGALYMGFHVAPSQVPNLTSSAALEHYATHGPIGCRDRYTLSLLRSHGVDAFLSHCLSLTFPRRIPDPDSQKDMFVVSRDRRILQYLPHSVAPFTFISHDCGCSDFAGNRQRAAELLKTYRDRAKLVVTTLPDCALPVIAMGIPVVVFYPPNDGSIEASERALSSSLAELVRVFRPEEAALVDWEGYTPDVGALKLQLVERFFSMAARSGQLSLAPIGPIAPSEVLPYSIRRNYAAAERVTELQRTQSPDRQRWGESSSYRSAWTERAKVAAHFIRDGSRVLEIGTGAGSLRDLIEHRCHYTGSDLEPIDQRTLVFDLDNDPMPCGSWDVIVLLSVLEYLYHPAEALRKISNTASQLVMSYCCCINEQREPDWVNSLTEESITAELAALGFRLSGRRLFDDTPYCQEIVFEFSK